MSSPHPASRSPTPAALSSVGGGLRPSAALLLCLVLAGPIATARHAATTMTWHEELRVHPQPPVVQFSHFDDGALRRDGRCDGDAQILRRDGSAPPKHLRTERPWLMRSEHPPRVSLCADGWAWPVLVDSYYAGLPWWPLTGPAGWALGLLGWRLMSALIGGLGLMLGWVWLRRWLGGGLATVAALWTAASACFAYLHGIAVMYEVMTWPLVVAAAALLRVGMPRGHGRGGEDAVASDAAASATAASATAASATAASATAASPTAASDTAASDVLASDAPALGARAAVVAGALLGLSLSTNVKALFVLAPALCWAAYLDRLPALGRRAALWLGLGALIGLAPMSLGTLVDHGVGLGAQGDLRLTRAWLRLQRPELRQFAGACVDVVDNAFDFGRLLAGSKGALPAPSPWRPLWALALAVDVGAALAALGLGPARARRLAVRLPAFALAALCGGLLIGGVLVAWLLYAQRPAINLVYLHGVYGWALAAPAALALAAMARALRPRSVLVGAGLVTALLVVDSHRHVGALAEVGLTLPQQRVAADWVESLVRARTSCGADARGCEVWTTPYNEIGVLDVLSRGRLRPLHIHHAFDPCLAVGAAARASCMRRQAGLALELALARETLVVSLADGVVQDELTAVMAHDAIAAAARARGVKVEAARAPPPAAGRRLRALWLRPER